jgi:hypothetical protein
MAKSGTSCRRGVIIRQLKSESAIQLGVYMGGRGMIAGYESCEGLQPVEQTVLPPECLLPPSNRRRRQCNLSHPACSILYPPNN